MNFRCNPHRLISTRKKFENSSENWPGTTWRLTGWSSKKFWITRCEKVSKLSILCYVDLGLQKDSVTPSHELCYVHSFQFQYFQNTFFDLLNLLDNILMLVASHEFERLVMEDAFFQTKALIEKLHLL